MMAHRGQAIKRRKKRTKKKRKKERTKNSSYLVDFVEVYLAMDRLNTADP